MRYLKVFVLTIDSESWLGSEIHPTREAAMRSLIDATASWPDGQVPEDDEHAIELLSDMNTFVCIEEKLIDTYQMEWSNG